MSLQALGADNETIIYLSADGDGTEVIPFKSIFLAEQYEDWSVTILNPSIAVTGTFFPEIQAVSQSGEWTINLSPETLLALGTVDTNIDQPLTVAQLDATVVKVEEQNPIDLSVISNKIPTGLEVDVNNRLKIDTELDQPLTLSQLQGITVKVSEQNPIEIAAIDSIDSKIPTGLEVVTGRLKVDANVALPSIYNVEAVALPLPNGAATSTNQTEIINTLDSLDTKLPTLTLIGDALKVDAAIDLPTTYPVEVNNYASLVTALESATLQAEITNNVSVVGSVDINTVGLATDANISIANDYLEVISNKLPTLTQPLTDTQLRASAVPVNVSNIPTVSQSGIWDINLPSGAATSANQTTINTTLNTINSKLPSNLTVTSNRLLVDNSGVTQPISGSVTVANQVNPLTDAQLRASAINVDITDYSELITLLEATKLQTDIKNNVSVIGDFYDNTGLATDANQFIGNNLLEAIESKIPVIDQPLTDSQLRASSITVSVDNFPNNQSLNGTVDANQSGVWNINNVEGTISLPTGATTEAKQDIIIGHIDSIETALAGVLNVDTGLVQSITNAELRATAINVTVDNFPATQIVSGTVTADTGLDQPLTDTQLRASAVPVSLASLPADASTSVKQDIGNTSLNSIDSKTPALGQALAAGSVPVVLTEAQINTLTPPTSVGITGTPTVNIGTVPTIAVTGTFWQATQPISAASLPLPSGASTSDLQTTGNSSLSSLDSKVPSGLTVNSTRLLTDGSGVTQPVSGVVDSNLMLNSLDVSATNRVPIDIPSYLTTLFSRLRVANDENQISIRQDNPVRLLMLTEGEVSGTGTSSSYLEREASTLLTVGPAAGLRRLRSKVAGLYTAGNGLLCFYTFNLEGSADNTVAKRCGYFDNNDGIFLEETNNVLYLVLRSSVTGSVVETRVPQSAWSYDKFDGTGQGYNFDKTKCHIGWISLEWLGVGDVYCGFVYNAEPILAHVFRNPNISALPYIRTANLFINYEIERLSPGTGSSSIRAICGVLKTEGSLNKMGVTQVIELGASRATANANTLYPLITFRLKSNYLNSRVLIEYFEAVINDNSNTTAKFLLVKNPVIAGYTFQPTSVPNSAIEYQNNLAPIIATNLTISSYEQLVLSKTITITSNAFVSGRSDSSPINFMGSSFNNTADLYCLAMTTTTASNIVPAASIYLWEQV